MGIEVELYGPDRVLADDGYGSARFPACIYHVVNVRRECGISCSSGFKLGQLGFEMDGHVPVCVSGIAENFERVRRLDHIGR